MYINPPLLASTYIHTLTLLCNSHAAILCLHTIFYLPLLLLFVMNRYAILANNTADKGSAIYLTGLNGVNARVEFSTYPQITDNNASTSTSAALVAISSSTLIMGR